MQPTTYSSEAVFQDQTVEHPLQRNHRDRRSDTEQPFNRYVTRNHRAADDEQPPIQYGETVDQRDVASRSVFFKRQFNKYSALPAIALV